MPLAPFTVKDLECLSLSQRVASCPSLQHVDVVCGTDGYYEKKLLFKDLGSVQRKETLVTDTQGDIVTELIIIVPSM